MKLVLHIIGKDFAFLRGRLAAWLAVMVAKFAIGYWLVLGANVTDRALTNIQGAVAGLIVIDAALTLLLAALLAQEDGVAGTGAFWRTRPVSGVRLLAAKVLGASFLLVVPAVLVALPWWWVCGFRIGEVTMAAIEVVVFQGVLLLVAFTAGSVTDSLGRCFVWGLVGVAGSYGIAGAWAYWLVKPVGMSGGPPVFYSVAFLVPVMLGTIVWQYLTRRRNVGLALLLGGMIVAPPAALLLGRMLGATRPLVQRQEQPELTRGVEVVWDSARIRQAQVGRRLGRIEVRYEVRGVPEGYVVNATMASHDVRYATGEILRDIQSSWGGENMGTLAVKLALQERGGDRGATGSRTGQVLSTFALEQESIARVRGEQIDFKARLTLSLVRPEVICTLPAEPGPWRARAGRGMRMVRLDAEATAVFLEAEPLGVASTAWLELQRQRTQRNFVYVLLQPERGFSILNAGRAVAGVALGGVQLRQRTLVVGRESATRSEVARNSITLVDLPIGTSFHREVKVPRMAVQQ